MRKLMLLAAAALTAFGADARMVTSDAHLFYGQPPNPNTQATGEFYRDFSGCEGRGGMFAFAQPPPRNVAAEPQPRQFTPRQEPPRQQNQPPPPPQRPFSQARGDKEHLNNPFFQPMQGQFTSVTDLGYNRNSIGVDIDTNSGTVWAGAGIQGGTLTSNNLTVTQNIAFGVTDELSIIGSARYMMSEAEWAWDNPSPGQGRSTDSMNQIDMFGIGAQWRFVDNQDWIGYLQGSFQSQTDIANMVSVGVKVGYKNDDTTLYMFGRMHYMMWQVHDLMFGLESGGTTLAFPVEQNVSNTAHFDIGIGAFIVLNSDWSVDTTVGLQDHWMRQVYGMAQLNYQPWMNAAISAYARVGLWDNSGNFNNIPVNFMPAPNAPWEFAGWGAITSHIDFSLGAKLTLLF